MEKIIADKTFEIRSLTRGEIKTLRKQGLNLAALSPDNADEAIDVVLESVLGERIAEIDELPNNVVLDLFKSIIDETFGQGEAAKNS